MRDEFVDFGDGIAVLPPIADEEPIFRPGDRIRIASRTPVGQYRMPFYLRGKRGTVEAVIGSPDAPNNADGHFGGTRPHAYRLAIPMTEIWPDYEGSPRDGLRIEVFEAWLARM
jgi:hypothetical protein